MLEQRTRTHPLFDPESQYSRLRLTLRPYGKMHGYFHFLWGRALTATPPFPVPPRLPRDEALALTKTLVEVGGGAAFCPDGRNGEIRGGMVPDPVHDHGIQVIDAWHTTALVLPLAEGDRVRDQAFETPMVLCLVREADGQHTLRGCSEGDGAWLRSLPACRCRVFLLEPEVLTRYDGHLGEGNWLDAFRPDVLADNFDIARSLAAAPELEGEVRAGAVVVEPVSAPECYDQFPPRLKLPQVVIACDAAPR